MTSGKADLVVMGRQRLADPLFNDKCAQGRADEIRGCLRCMRCFPGPFEDVEGEMRMAMERGDPYRPFQEMRGCSVDPEHQHGKLGGFPPAQRLKRVLAET